ncbi:MAG TPA: DUF2182 domain-containing protein [Jatrophihabitantaceae bacterium]|jgi:hypothetical protein
MTGARTAATVAALIATLGLAVASWMVAAWQMTGMDMGVATKLGSFRFFTALWVSMMAAMMLPGAVPAVLRRVHVDSRARVVPLFVGSYLATWVLVGVAVFAVYRPHGSAAAAAIVIAVVLLAQKVLPPRATVDVPLALAILGLGIWIVTAPASVPGLMPSM